MLEKEDFLIEWLKLEGSFSRTLNDKIRNAWYAEVEMVEVFLFKKTMRQLTLGAHFTTKSSTFPRFKDFWTIHGMVKNEHRLDNGVGQEVESIGCGMCVRGMLHFLKQYKDYPEPYEVVAFCRRCHPDRFGARDPRDRFDFVEGMEPERHQRSFAIPPDVNLGMYEDFTKKWMDPKTDWQKETIEAWAMHYRAVKRSALA